MLIPLSFIERRFRNDTSRFHRFRDPTGAHPPLFASDKSNECVIYEIECFNKLGAGNSGEKKTPSSSLDELEKGANVIVFLR